MASKYNLNNPAVKRIMRELREMEKESNPLFTARPLEDNLFEWHFTIRGAKDTPFEGGIYHGRIILPADYPFQPPEIALLTPSGRFEVGTKICLSLTAHHPELWQPGWSIRTVLLALISFMPTKGEGAIGALDYTTAERQELAKKSRTWKCSKCLSENATALPPEVESESPSAQSPSPPSPQPERTTTSTTPNTVQDTSISNNTNTTNKVVTTPPTPSTNNNNNNTIHNNNNNNTVQPQQQANPNRIPFQGNQLPPNQYPAQQYQGNQYMYQANVPQYVNQFQQPNQFYPQMHYANQRPAVSDAVRRQQAFLDLVILSLFLAIMALVINKLSKISDM